jgi:hypothetical protein
MAKAAELDCEPLRPADAAVDDGVAIECTIDEDTGTSLTLLELSDVDALRDHWTARLDSVEPPVEELANACRKSKAGSRTWGFGNIACLADEGSARLLWTDQRNNTYGVIGGTDAKTSELFKWWKSTGRALGRATTEPVEPTPGNGEPLVRVPGNPRDISCAALSEPIPDVWGRTWTATKIDFLERPNYERVVIRLERAGKTRNGRDTEVIVERMPVSKLKRAVPNAPTPKRGKTAIVVRMNGLKSAPTLLGYRPSSTDIIKEFSLVKDGRSRAAVLSTLADTCYQVRVPIFGPSATGKERKAQIYIDLKKQ